jgi:uncharacterized protein (DUF2237 family)
MMQKLNLLGEPLLPCSHQPLTGYFRDGYCRTDAQDRGRHVVCAQVTEAFLAYSKAQGNDLITPQLGFPGLKPGDFWCLCALRWLEAFEAGVAPPIVFAATDQALLSYVELKVLQSFALDKTI